MTTTAPRPGHAAPATIQENAVSYDFNPYSSPEKFGLTTVGEVEWGEAFYSFDLTTVWRNTETGALYFADDSGCSCPSPYETTSITELTQIDRPQTFIDHINQRISGLSDSEWSKAETERCKADAGELVQKVRGLLR